MYFTLEDKKASLYIMSDSFFSLWIRNFTSNYPFKPWYKNAYSSYCSPYISYEISEENLSKYQDILSFMITFIILIAGMFEWVLIM